MDSLLICLSIDVVEVVLHHDLSYILISYLLIYMVNGHGTSWPRCALPHDLQDRGALGIFAAMKPAAPQVVVAQLHADGREEPHELADHLAAKAFSQEALRPPPRRRCRGSGTRAAARGRCSPPTRRSRSGGEWPWRGAAGRRVRSGRAGGYGLSAGDSRPLS